MRFGEYLTDTLKKAGLSQRVFSIRAGYGQQNINKIARGQRVPPLKHLETWADLLADHIDRERFLELARLEHSPPEIRALVERLRAEVGRLREGSLKS